jgi:DNA-binding response OmpR family regulator
VSKWIPVLVVDDDELVRKALKRSLTLYGFQAYLAEDGLTRLKLAQEKGPTTILRSRRT